MQNVQNQVNRGGESSSRVNLWPGILDTPPSHERLVVVVFGHPSLGPVAVDRDLCSPSVDS